MRKIKLKHIDNELNLNSQDHFISNLAGLGISKKITTIAIPSGTKYIDSNFNDLAEITGNIIFKNQSQYEKFVSFIQKSNDLLELVYEDNNKENIAQITLKELTKGEGSGAGLIESNVRFLRTTNWYQTVGDLDGIIHTLEIIYGKQYPYTYPYSLQMINPHYTIRQYKVDTIFDQWVNIKMSPTVAKPHIIFRNAQTKQIIGEFKADEDLRKDLNDIVNFYIISTPWNREAYALLGNGAKVSIVDKLSIDDNIQNFIALPKGDYLIEVDDLEPATPEESIKDIFNFTFIEERMA